MRNLRVQKFLRELAVGVAAPSDLAGSIIVGILHCGEGGDVEQVTRTLKQISRVCGYLSLPLSLMFYILHALIVYIYYMLDIPFCFIYIHAWGCLLTLVFNQERHSGTSILNLEES